jgi:hypothetical protein
MSSCQGVDKRIFEIIFMAMRSTQKAKEKTVKMGRPPKPESERRTKIIKVLTTEAEYELLSEAAKESGRELSGWLRFIALREAKELLGKGTN